jgi:O-antigen/teichoic acid export membrane protein
MSAHLGQEVTPADGEISPVALLGRGAFYQLLARISMILSSYAVHLVLGRVLGPARYGTIGTLLSTLTILRTVVVNVTRQVVSKTVADASMPVDSIRRWSAGIQSVGTISIALVYFLLAGQFARLLRDPALEFYFKVSAPFIPLVGWYAIQLATLNGIGRFAEQGLTIIVYNTARLVFALGYVWIFSSIDHETSAILGFMTAPLVASVVAQRLYTRHLPKQEGHSDGHATDVGKTSARFIFDVFFAALGTTLLLNSGQLIVKRFGSSPDQVGYYTAANAIGLMPYVLLLAFSDVIIPVVVRAQRSTGITGAGNIIIRTWQYMAWVSCLILALVGSTATSLVTWTYTPEYAPAASLVLMSCVAFSLLAMFVMLSNAITATYSSRFVLFASIGVTCGTVLFGVWGARLAGARGFLIAMIVSLVTVLAVYMVYLHNRGSSLDLSGLRWPIVGAALVAAVAVLIRPERGMLVLAYLVLSAAYMALLWFLGTINRQEKQAVISFARRMLHRVGL